MKLVRDARTLKTKAIKSLRTAMAAFNTHPDLNEAPELFDSLVESASRFSRRMICERVGRVPSTSPETLSRHCAEHKMQEIPANFTAG